MTERPAAEIYDVTSLPAIVDIGILDEQLRMELWTTLWVW